MQSVETILQQLDELYARAVDTLRADVLAFARDGTLPAPSRSIDGSYAYPELRVRFGGGEPLQGRSRAFGRLNTPGTYATTVTRPALFADYLRDQLEHITGDYDVEMEVRPSRQEIPFPYVLDGAAGAEMAGISPQELARHFPATELALIGDELADCIELGDPAKLGLGIVHANHAPVPIEIVLACIEQSAVRGKVTVSVKMPSRRSADQNRIILP